MKIGIIGLGVVGETIYNALRFYHKDIVGYDKFKPSNSLDEVIQADFVFVAVPTGLNGCRLDCSLVKETLEMLEKTGFSGILILKSTLSIGFVKEIEKSNLRVVVMPELLHERTRLQDFVRPKVIIIAGKETDVKLVMNEVFYWLEEKTPVFFVDYLTAVMAKLVLNSFAATKISFSNEVGRICRCYEIDPKLIMRILVSEGRASPEYTDPTKGAFEGKCLPKDLEELINCSDKSILLRAVKEVNNVVREEQEKTRKKHLPAPQ
jgi:nucleotide sugar dehydrogenase